MWVWLKRSVNCLIIIYMLDLISSWLNFNRDEALIWVVFCTLCSPWCSMLLLKMVRKLFLELLDQTLIGLIYSWYVFLDINEDFSVMFNWTWRYATFIHSLWKKPVYMNICKQCRPWSFWSPLIMVCTFAYIICLTKLYILPKKLLLIRWLYLILIVRGYLHNYSTLKGLII